MQGVYKNVIWKAYIKCHILHMSISYIAFTIFDVDVSCIVYDILHMSISCIPYVHIIYCIHILDICIAYYILYPYYVLFHMTFYICPYYVLHIEASWDSQKGCLYVLHMTFYICPYCVLHMYCILHVIWKVYTKCYKKCVPYYALRAYCIWHFTYVQIMYCKCKMLHFTSILCIIWYDILHMYSMTCVATHMQHITWMWCICVDMRFNTYATHNMDVTYLRCHMKYICNIQ